MSEIRYTYCDGLMGRMLLAANERGLRSINFAASKRAERPQADWQEDGAFFSETLRQLRAYFEGELREFDVLLAPEGTEFQMRVWESLREIPYGETISYGRLAARVGKCESVARRGSGERIESDSHHYSVPSGDRERWEPGGLRWRAGKQEDFARAGKPATLVDRYRLGEIRKLRIVGVGFARRPTTFPALRVHLVQALAEISLPTFRQGCYLQSFLE